jgi:hypothetical protein
VWIATVDGFFSVVQDRLHPGEVLVRARARPDLRRLLRRLGERSSIVKTPLADYPFRIRIPRRRWARYLRLAALAIDYPNFKAAILTRLGLYRESTLLEVWKILRRIEAEPGAFS